MTNRKFIKHGLIGGSLSHSFSKNYLESQWKKEGGHSYFYELLEFENEKELGNFFSNDVYSYRGLNVTIPYKVLVKRYMHAMTHEAKEIDAINCIAIKNNQLIGHNTDGPAFLLSLKDWLPSTSRASALILGDGGASKAVQWALRKLKINYSIVTRNSNILNYSNLRSQWDDKFQLIIQTTPVGMYPKINDSLNIPFDKLNSNCFVYDLIYNPDPTVFLQNSLHYGANCMNGLKMLQLQADLSNQFWKDQLGQLDFE
ncbi:MAG: shikimate dehydrogenase [Saprospiraceae bacterium]|nr:shikimate dehydrogenase [Saprospiraceae bacterium]